MAENMPDQTGRATGSIRPAETEEYSQGGGDLLNVGTSSYAKWANYLRKHEEKCTSHCFQKLHLWLLINKRQHINDGDRWDICPLFYQIAQTTMV